MGVVKALSNRKALNILAAMTCVFSASTRAEAPDFLKFTFGIIGGASFVLMLASAVMLFINIKDNRIV
ncbi:MAG: hypothetical protein ACYDG2_26995 [Ruminiclostridium sp.]